MWPFITNWMRHNGKCSTTCTQLGLTAIQFPCLWTVTENPPEAIHLGSMNMWRRLRNSGLCSSPRNSFQMLYADSATMWLLSKFLWWSFVIAHGFQLYILHENMVTSSGYLLLNRAEDGLHFNSCNYLHTKIVYLLPKHHGHFFQLYTLLFPSDD